MARLAARLTGMLLALGACVLVLLSTHDAAHAHSSIRIATSSDATALGLPVRWNLSNPSGLPNVSNRRVRYLMGAAGTADAPTFTGPFNEFEAIQRSFTTWRNIPGSEIDFHYAGTTANPVEDGNDSQNMIFWTDTGTTPGVFAITVTTFETAGASAGEIVDADMIFNDTDFDWDTLANGATAGTIGLTYIENIATHEIGHVLGLDHSFNSPGTMFPFTDPGAINFFSLEGDDVAQVVTDHPDPDAQASTNATVSGNVADATQGRFGVVVTLVNIATGKAIISSVTDKDNAASTGTAAGDYTITEVPPGNYWVFASKLNPSNIGSYYSSSFTSLLPTPLGVAVGTTDTPTILRVHPGEALTGVDITVGTLAAAFETNDDTTGATAITVGDALGARIESTSDEDFYSFTAASGDEVVVQVHADSLGQTLNPQMTVFRADGATKIATGEFGDPQFDQSARDLEPDAFGVDGVDFDCRVSFTAPATETYYVRVSPTSGTSGDYILTTYSDATFNTVDVNATTLAASIPGGTAGGATFSMTVVPKNSAEIAFPNSDSFNVELLDVTSGTTVLDTSNGTGPWTFTVTPPAVASSVIYGVRIDAVVMDATLTLPFTTTPNAGQSSINVVSTSLIADGSDSSRVEMFIRDAGGRLVVDDQLTVEVTTTAGTLTAGANSGTTIDAQFETATGLWIATITAPSSGSALTVSATVNTQSIGSEAVALTPAAQGAGSGSPTVTSPATLPSGRENQGYSFTFAVTGGSSPYAWTDSGGWPTGLTLATDGVLSGTPTQQGTFNVTVTVTDGLSATDNHGVTLTIDIDNGSTTPTITTSSLPNGRLAVDYSQGLAVTGGTPAYTWDMKAGSDPLPDGLQISTGGLIFGTPTVKGSFTFTVEVTDNATQVDEATYTIVITKPAEDPPDDGCALSSGATRNSLAMLLLLALIVFLHGRQRTDRKV